VYYASVTVTVTGTAGVKKSLLGHNTSIIHDRLCCNLLIS